MQSFWKRDRNKNPQNFSAQTKELAVVDSRNALKIQTQRKRTRIRESKEKNALFNALRAHLSLLDGDQHHF
jgi:hypothetical protein